MENKITIAGNPITIGQIRMLKEDIATWVDAVKKAENVQKPDWQRLIEIYQNIIKDSRLRSMITKRIRPIKNTKILVRNPDKSINEQLTEIFKTPWFLDLLSCIMEARFWGYTVLEVQTNAKGVLEGIYKIPRQNIRISKSELLRFSGAVSGIPYKTGQTASYVMEVTDGYGLLLEAAPLVLYKRGAVGDWAQLCELFGMPIREYTYNPQDPESRKEAEKAAREAGSASYLVVPQGTTLKLHKGVEASQTGSLHDILRRAMNEELTILILGQTMTTTDGSSRSQAEVHENVEKAIHLEDRIWVANILNYSVKPILAQHGYDIGQCYFEFPETQTMTISEQMEMDIKLASVIPIDKEYLATKYGVKLQTQTPETAIKQESGKKKILDLRSLSNLRYHSKPVNESLSDEIEQTINQIIRLLHQGNINPEEPLSDNEVKRLLKIVNEYLQKGLTEGYGTAYTEPDKILLEKLRTNIYTFSAFRDYSIVSDMARFLFDSKGNLRTFADFKRDALQIHKAYNELWLQAEYNTTVASGQAAAKWVTIIADREQFPLLTYKTQGDNNVRDAHRKLNGITLPMEHPFWNTHYPPNAWQCRCFVTQRNADAEQTPSEKVTDIPTPQSPFNQNVGKTGEVFNQTHTYFQQEPKVKQYINSQI